MPSLCQLAGEYGGAPLPAGGTMAEPKIDGWRCLFFPDHLGKPALWSRNGIPLQGVAHILRRLNAVERAIGFPVMIDGELQIGGTLAATKAHCERGWRQGDAGTFHAFDCVPLVQWRSDNCDMPLYQRKKLLAGAIAATAPDPNAWEWEPGSRGRNHGIDPIRLMPEMWLMDREDVASSAHDIWRAGGEGLMLKDAESPYRRKRTDAWRKIKTPAQLERMP